MKAQFLIDHRIQNAQAKKTQNQALHFISVRMISKSTADYENEANTESLTKEKRICRCSTQKVNVWT